MCRFERTGEKGPHAMLDVVLLTARGEIEIETKEGLVLHKSQA